MRIVKGKGGSVTRRDQAKIDRMNNEVKFDICPTCNGEGRAELPDFSGSTESAYWWFRKLKEALSKKPDGVDLLLMNNQLVVIETPDEEGILEPEKVRLHLGEGGTIRYITSEIKYQFDEEDDLSNVNEEELVEELKKSMNQKSETENKE